MINSAEQVVFSTGAGQGGTEFAVGHSPTQGSHATNRPEGKQSKAGADIKQLKTETGEDAGPYHIGDDNRGEGRESELI